MRILVLVVLLALCPFHTAYSSVVRIGEVDPLTGKLSKHGNEIHEGILYAVEEVNQRGGLRGLPVELVSRDDQSLPEVAVSQTEDLLYRNRVSGLVGGYVDSLVGPISELAAKHRTPYVASASLQRSLTVGRQNPFFFRVSHMDGIVKPLCSFAAQTFPSRRIGILYASTPGSTEWGMEIRSCFQKSGLDVAVFEKFRPGSPDFSAFLLKLKHAKVDVLLSGGFYADHLILVRQIRELQVPLKAYVAPWGVAYPSFVEEMGAAAEGLLGMCAWSPEIALAGSEQESQAFATGFFKRFHKRPNSTTMHGYTSARALLTAIENTLAKGQELTGEAIGMQLRLLDLALPMERLAFDRNGDPTSYEQVIVQIQKGRMVGIHPPGRSTGKME